MAGLKSIVADHVAGEWYSVPELRLRDHRFTVPLDYNQSTENSPKISIFAREVVSVGKEDDVEMPYLLYLEGGPGVPSPRPTESTGWLARALKDFRVVLIDSRGTGLSTALTSSSMSQFGSATELVEYLKNFRADNIVKDAEFVRIRIVPGAGPWTVLGQSYGGFCAVTYLSFAAQGLKQVLLAGGIPPIGKGCAGDFAERACFKQIRVQNRKYYKRFPQDAELVRDLVNHLSQCEKGGVDLPSGGILTPKGLQSLGLYFLGAHLGFERLHYMLETVWDPVIVPGAPKRISYNFLHEFENCVSYKTTLLSPLLGEAAYCQGGSSRWAAQRARDEFGGEFDAIAAVNEGRPVLFTSEMFFPWIFDEFENLRPFKEAAHILAQKDDWPMLYDIDALNNNKVPVVAAVYYEDTSVGFKASTETASQIAGIRLFVTNEYLHSGLSDSGGRVFDYLMGMLTGKKPLF